MKNEKRPIITTEDHKVIAWNIFVASEHLNRLHSAISAIKPAKLKYQVRKNEAALRYSLDDLRDYLETVAGQDIDASTAFDLYYPGRITPAPETLACSDSQLAQAFDTETRRKTRPNGKGQPRFTIIDFVAITDFLDTAIAGKVELAAGVIAAEMPDRKKRGELDAVIRNVTDQRLKFCKTLRAAVLMASVEGGQV